MAFKKGQKVAKVIMGGGYKTVSFNHTIDKVGRVVEIEGSILMYNKKTGEELEAVIPGFSSRITSYENAVAMVKAGEWALDGDQVLPKL